MTAPQIHLIFNHFPLIISLIAIPILCYGIYKNSSILIKTGFILNIAVLIFTLPLYLSGEEAEEVVEHMEHVSHDFIHEHEEIAEKSFVIAIFLGIISLAGLLNFPQKFSSIMPKVVLVASVLSFILFAYVAHLGGRISHPELREGFVPNIENHNHGE